MAMRAAVRAPVVIRQGDAVGVTRRTQAHAANGFGAGSRDRSSSSGRAPDQVIQGLEQVAGNEARKQTTTVMGESDFYELDAQVNEYPMHRTFKAIGIDDGSLKEDMRKVVDNAVSNDVSVHEPATRPSRKGNYVSVHVGPVRVDHREQVVNICMGMQNDTRVRWVI